MCWMISRQHFDREISRIGELLNFARLSQQVLKTSPDAIRVLEFDDLTTDGFFARAIEVSSRLGEEGLYWGVLEPHPLHYFYQHFSRFPWLRINVDDSPAEVLEALHEDPGGSPADAVAVNSDLIVAYSDGLRWCILGDRDLEVALLATMDEGATCAWEEISSESLLTVEEALAQLFPAIFREGMPADLEAAFRENYGAQEAPPAS